MSKAKLPLVEVLRITLNLKAPPIAKSGLPLPSKSPMATELGFEPTIKSALSAKLMLLLVDVLRITETEFEPLFAVAKSDLPSPSKSPMATEKGFKPVPKSTLSAKLRLPMLDVFRITETEFEPSFPTAKSGLLSPSKSPIATELGLVPVVKSTLVAKLRLPTLDVLRITETKATLFFATAKSGLPSPSKSPMATDQGESRALMVKFNLVAKLMLPLVEVLRNTVTAVPPNTAKSGLPSPSKSPMATEVGESPMAKSTLVSKLPELILPLVAVFL